MPFPNCEAARVPVSGRLEGSVGSAEDKKVRGSTFYSIPLECTYFFLFLLFFLSKGQLRVSQQLMPCRQQHSTKRQPFVRPNHFQEMGGPCGMHEDEMRDIICSK